MPWQQADVLTRVHCRDRRILVFIRYGGARFQELQHGLGLSKAQLWNRLVRLRRLGLIRRQRKGWYEREPTP